MWHRNFDFLLLDFPVFHALILIIALACLGGVVNIYVKVRFICQVIDKCPACGKNTLFTTQHCLSCRFIRQHANDLPGKSWLK
jgi:hypothetical protein